MSYSSSLNWLWGFQVDQEWGGVTLTHCDSVNIKVNFSLSTQASYVLLFSSLYFKL